MKKHWLVQSEPPKTFYDVYPELPHVVLDLVYHRNLHSQEQIDEFLNPDYSQDVHDPFLFSDMEKSVNRIFQAIEKNEKIVVHGDYDSDGVCASVILVSTLEALGAKQVQNYLPDRETDGYGLNEKNMRAFAQEDVKLVISCDCGISNAPEVKIGNELGIDTIITDHHSIPENLPEAFAILHPKIESENYPDKNLAGGGVAFKLAQGLLLTHKKQGKELLCEDSHEAHEKWLLELVAISSVADMVPLLGESRTLTKYGLIVLNKTRRIGLQMLLREANLMEMDGSLKKEITAETIGFSLAPRINAAGRLDHSNVAYKLLMTKNAIEATDLAFALENNNKDRKNLTKEYLEVAIEQVKKDQMENPVLVVFNENWSSGLVGLIASRLKDLYNKPTLACTHRNGEIVGSGRSIDQFNLIAALQKNPEFFSKVGGHPAACGFTLKDNNQFENFKKTLIETYNQETKGQKFEPTLHIDAVLTLDTISWDLYDLLNKFQPFGQKNPSPTYVAFDVRVHRIDPLGKSGEHLKLSLEQNGKIKTAIGWSLCKKDNEDSPNWCSILKQNDIIDIVFEMEVNEWNGNRELRMKIIDLHKHI